MKTTIGACLLLIAAASSVNAQDFSAFDRLEGVWYPTRHQDKSFEPCYDSESPWRAAIGRFNWDSEASVLRFGEQTGSERAIGFYEAFCTIGEPLVKGDQMAMAADCTAEGEDYTGFVTIRTIDAQTLAISTPVNNGEDYYSACRVDNASIAWHQPPDMLPYGSRAGMDVTVRGAAALDTEAATIYVEHTRENARSFCVQYALSLEEDCVNSTMKENEAIPTRLTANCTTGFFKTAFGTEWQFLGPSISKDEFAPEYNIYNVSTKERADGSSASGYYEALAVVSALCPAFVTDGED